MKELIYENEGSLSKELCEKFIKYFDSNEQLQNEGVIGLNKKNGEYGLENKVGVNKNVKESMDIYILLNKLKNGTELFSMVNCLLENLKINLQFYIGILKEQNICFSTDKLSVKELLLQKYISNEGKFAYHTDFKLEKEKYRLINFIWYLNDVEEGGETEFFGNYRIKPTQGKIVFFPSEWFFPHQGKTPLSNNKYIITGWLHTEV